MLDAMLLWWIPGSWWELYGLMHQDVSRVMMRLGMQVGPMVCWSRPLKWFTSPRMEYMLLNSARPEDSNPWKVEKGRERRTKKGERRGKSGPPFRQSRLLVKAILHLICIYASGSEGWILSFFHRCWDCRSVDHFAALALLHGPFSNCCYIAHNSRSFCFMICAAPIKTLDGQDFMILKNSRASPIQGVSLQTDSLDNWMIGPTCMY